MPHVISTRWISRRHALSIVMVGIGLAALIGLLSLTRWAPMSRLDSLFLDVLLARSATGRPPSNAVVVDIDDVSLSALGQWPWPRYRVASLLQRIAVERPAAIALDVLFPEADRSSLLSVQQTLKRDFGLDVTFSGVPAGLMDNDGFLGHVMGQHDVIAASYLYFDHLSPPDGAPGPGLSFDGRTDLLKLHVATGIMPSADGIAQQTHVSGFVNQLKDGDGVLRRLPLLIRHAGVIHPNLSLAAVMRSLGVSAASIDADGDGLSIRIGKHRVPVDEAGFATLQFEGAATLYPALSAVDVLNGRVGAGDLRGKIVFVGTSAVGLNDVHHTALDPSFPGLKVHAVMAQNILDDRAVGTPAWAPSAVFVACVTAGLLMSLIFVAGRGVYPMVFASGLLAVVTVSTSVVLHARSGLFVSAAAPTLVVAALFVLFFVAGYAIERRRAQAWQRQLENARQVTIESMASVAETRDPETGAHIKRTQNYVRAIAQALKRDGHYLNILSEQYIDLLYLSAPLHDIGKVGVPDHILLKPGRLTPEEMVLMKQHAEFGRKVIHSTAQHIEGDNFLVIAGEIAATHHEKWDGTGYPHGLSGQDIPLAGRIMAVADIYDALISRRCYKEPFPHAVATTMMQEGRGKTFDPVVLDAFFSIEDEIKAIAARFQDEAERVLDPAATAASLIGRLTAQGAGVVPAAADAALPSTREVPVRPPSG
jgi:HD-GYP domain-containing protein (c-di-GMP phosphodiesterase class II)